MIIYSVSKHKYFSAQVIKKHYLDWKCDRFPESIPNTDLLLVSVQNGSIHQKDAVNDDDFEPYLSSQTNQVSEYYFLEFNCNLVDFET